MPKKIEKQKVFCPNCKKQVEIKNEISGRCSECQQRIPALFEKEVREFLKKEWGVELKKAKVKINKLLEKEFDLVSDDCEYVGDAKFFKPLKNPVAKNSTIAEYVWYLQNTKAKRKFLIFGRDIEIPNNWVKKHKLLLKDVEIYFFNHEKQKLIKLPYGNLKSNQQA
jgi:DNA-directed RNA polymerase subunit RPC12/RpoP